MTDYCVHDRKYVLGINRLVTETSSAIIEQVQLANIENLSLPAKYWCNFRTISELVVVLANDYVDNFSIYGANYLPNKERLVQSHMGFDDAVERFFNCVPDSPVKERLIEHVKVNVLSEMVDWIYGFVAGSILHATWRVWSVELIGSSLVLSEGYDYRVLEWYRLTNQEVPLR